LGQHGVKQRRGYAGEGHSREAEDFVIESGDLLDAAIVELLH
jgi:hypothetical protein